MSRSVGILQLCATYLFVALNLVAIVYLLRDWRTNSPTEQTNETYEENDKEAQSATGIYNVRERIQDVARAHNIDAETAIRIAECESSLDTNARSVSSSATGIYQFTKGTWEWIGADGDRTDPEASIREFVKWYPKYPHWWVCK